MITGTGGNERRRPTGGYAMRILIADDDLTSRTMLSAILTKAGHEVVVTVDGDAAWEAMRAARAPDLAILDWMMPGLDGPDVIRKIRAITTDRPPYIILLTALGEKVNIVRGLEAGANDYLSKPFDPGELKARVGVGCRMLAMQAALLESREALAHQAAHDNLTGLLNRRAIFACLEQELDRGARQQSKLAVGMVDIDFFKKVNDQFGHQAGDDILIAVADTMRRSLRPYDTVGRIGGEEFLVVVPLAGNAPVAPAFERLRHTIAQTPIQTRSGPVSVTLSIGVAAADEPTSLDTLLERADKALYRAKETGRNRTQLAAPLHASPQPAGMPP